MIVGHRQGSAGRVEADPAVVSWGFHPGPAYFVRLLDIIVFYTDGNLMQRAILVSREFGRSYCRREPHVHDK